MRRRCRRWHMEEFMVAGVIGATVLGFTTFLGYQAGLQQPTYRIEKVVRVDEKERT